MPFPESVAMGLKGGFDVAFESRCNCRRLAFNGACSFDRTGTGGNAIFTNAQFLATPIHVDIVHTGRRFPGSVSAVRTDVEGAMFAASANFKPSHFLSVTFFNHCRFLDCANFDGSDVKIGTSNSSTSCSRRHL